MAKSIDRCAKQRAALKAKQTEINALHNLKAAAQQSLQQASPSAKAGIVLEIKRLSALIAQAEARLPALQTALEKCQFPASKTKGTGAQAGSAKA